MSDHFEEWNKAFCDSRLTMSELSKISDVCVGQLRGYVNGERVPKEKNLKKMEIFMRAAKSTPRIQWHPVRGYATEEQYEKLKRIGVGAERNLILEQIEYQTIHKGKVRMEMQRA